MRLHSIRRIYEHSAEREHQTLLQCRAILLSQFPYMSGREADAILLTASDRTSVKHRHVLLVAENRHGQVLGVVFATHFLADNFIFLDYIASNKKTLSGGMGGALYERLREEAASISALGIFFDCLPDVLQWSANAAEHQQNVARLRFYEKYAARPLEGLNYELARSDGAIFNLVYDGLGGDKALPVAKAKAVVTAILRTKGSKTCSARYVTQVTDSIRSPLRPRPFKYAQPHVPQPVMPSVPADKRIHLVINEGHSIHHVRERGYLESPIRVTTILKELDKTQLMHRVPAKEFPDKWIRAVHDHGYLNFLKEICARIGTGPSQYGNVFPVRNAARLPGDIGLQIGYYCIDTATPLNGQAYLAARAAVDCALTAAEAVHKGRQLSYALVRPPGHHAERKYFGGFCYLNSSAIAANYLTHSGRVAILDLDYHHGNGQQDIFYNRADVYTVSIHGDPEYAYPNFAGFADEVGEGPGEGFNLNLPMPEDTDGAAYHRVLQRALKAIEKYKPAYLVIALGLDIAKGDPTGSWSLSPTNFYENGKMVAGSGLPTVVIQEGGYKNRALGVNARSFFQGLWDGYYA